MGSDDRSLGQVAWDARCAWLADQAPVHGHTLIPRPWEQLDDFERELYDRTASAVAVAAVAEAGLVNERRDAQLFALRSHLPAVLDALRVTAADAPYRARARRFRDALVALGGEE